MQLVLALEHGGRVAHVIPEAAMEGAIGDAMRSLARFARGDGRDVAQSLDPAERELVSLLASLAVDDPAVEAVMPQLLLLGHAVRLVLERAAGAARARAGRNDPCPCGSGRKFKKCCAALAETPPVVELGDTAAEQRFAEYMQVVQALMAFRDRLDGERDGRWLRRQDREFERRFRPGTDHGVPDSLHVLWLLVDLELPSGRTVVDLYRERQGAGLGERAASLLRDLAASHTSFYELVALVPERGQKRLRELLTGVEWTVADVEDPDAREGTPGDVWLCRFVGERDDALTLATPLAYPPEARPDLESVMRLIVRGQGAPGAPTAEDARVAMKRGVVRLADYLVWSAQGGPGELTIPALPNMDGHRMLPTTLRYALDDPMVARVALADLAGDEGADEEEGRWTIPWLRVGGSDVLPSTLLALFRIAGRTMTVEVNSRERAEAVRRPVAERLGLSARLVEVREADLAERLRADLADPALSEKVRRREERQALLFREHPEMADAVGEDQRAYYARWLDTSVPALGGRPPRQAATTAAGRREVAALLDELARMDARRPAYMPGLDVGALRRELGIERYGDLTFWTCRTRKRRAVPTGHLGTHPPGVAGRTWRPRENLPQLQLLHHDETRHSAPSPVPAAPPCSPPAPTGCSGRSATRVSITGRAARLSAVDLLILDDFDLDAMDPT